MDVTFLSRSKSQDLPLCCLAGETAVVGKALTGAAAAGQDQVFKVRSCDTIGFHQAAGCLVKTGNELLIPNLLETAMYRNCLWLYLLQVGIQEFYDLQFKKMLNANFNQPGWICYST